jgi:hypothetical protein
MKNQRGDQSGIAIATVTRRLGFQKKRILQEPMMINLLYIMNSMGSPKWFLEAALLSFLEWKRCVLF